MFGHFYLYSTEKLADCFENQVSVYDLFAQNGAVD
jgi:hypothetical protein